jgi:hypothetical protein
VLPDIGPWRVPSGPIPGCEHSNLPHTSPRPIPKHFPACHTVQMRLASSRLQDASYRPSCHGTMQLQLTVHTGRNYLRRVPRIPIPPLMIAVSLAIERLTKLLRVIPAHSLNRQICPLGIAPVGCHNRFILRLLYLIFPYFKGPSNHDSMRRLLLDVTFCIPW